MSDGINFTLIAADANIVMTEMKLGSVTPGQINTDLTKLYLDLGDHVLSPYGGGNLTPAQVQVGGADAYHVYADAVAHNGLALAVDNVALVGFGNSLDHGYHVVL